MLKPILAIFIIAHGLVHSGLAAAPNPNDPNSKLGAIFTAAERSWLLPNIGLSPESIKWTGLILVILSTLGFVISGLGIFGLAGFENIWRESAVFSAITSLLLLFLFWHPWFPVGILIDIAILIALLGIKWPLDHLLG
ncbi:MAG: hypothetical protein JEZ06_01520 [Anaerolineaceae bacterium]|nr:hypothetical protein [Anaerolineaceae bacterium]